MKKQIKILSLVLMSLLLIVCVFVGCQSGATPADTTAQTEADTAAQTTPSTEATADTTQPTETQAVTEEATQAPTPWEQDTGVFNQGVVDYNKEVVTQVLEAFPTEKLGQVMQKGDTGVSQVFHSDFEDNDPTAGGEASFWKPASFSSDLPGNVGCHDGSLYIPYDESKDNLIGSNWNVWSPNASTMADAAASSTVF